jgi:glyoxylase-like metal-dependent hydrolase (beta-lactamase superfamily II)
MVEKVETWIDNTVLGDMLFEALYSNYKDFGGIKFPSQITQKQGGYPIFDLTVTDVKPNVPVNIQPPQGRGAAPAAAPAAGQPARPPSEKLGDGVYLILGGYSSIAVDFKDHIVVIEGPQSQERANAIIAEAKQLIPNKPIRYVVNTHQHFDHAGGLRTFVAEGATIITHEINKPYYERIFANPHKLNPDKLSQTGKKPSIETMTEKKVLTDGNHVIELHHVKDSGHNQGLVMVYLPKEKVLLQADSYNPPAEPNAPVVTPYSPYNLNLVANIERLKLDVQRIIPVHYPADGRKVTMAELLRVVGRGN